MSIRKMTFSLASLILIFAFVAVMPVMAHEVTDTNSASGQVHEGDTVGDTNHAHPEIMVTIADADPTTMGTQVVDTEADTPDFTSAVDPTIQFEVTLTVPVGAEAAGSPVAAGTFGNVTAVAYKSDFTPVGTGTAGALSFTGTGWVQGTTNTREWTATALLTLANVPAVTTGADADENAALTEAAHDAAIAAAIEAGIMVDVTVPADTIQTSGLVGGPMMNQGNLESKTRVTIIAMAVTNQRPTLMISTPELTDAVETSSFDIMYTAMDTESDPITVEASHTVAPSGAAMHYTIDTSTTGTVTVNQATPDATTPMIPAASVTVTITPSDADGPGMAQTFTVFFAAAAYTAPNQLPTVTTTPATAPADAVTDNSYAFTYATMDADSGDTVTVGVSHAVSPTGAAAHYTVDSTTTAGTVTVTQATPDATTMMIPAATVTVTLTPNDGTEDGAAVTFAVAFTAKAYTDPSANMLNAGDYLVVVRDKANPPPFGNLSPTLASWSEVSDEAEMPDLERLFDIGGSINVKVTGATRLQVVFSEVMWAVDQGNVDDRAAYLGEQWIELHNRTSDKNFALSAIKINTKERRPALAEETDRISTVVGGGEDWVLGKGQNGNSGAADGSGKVEFISMYRNNEGEPGHQSSRWTKSSELYATNHRGTPGQKERAGVQVIGPTNANRSPIIFNEIGNHSNPMYEWIELKNVSGGNVNLKNYEVTMATTKGANQSSHNDVDLIDFTGADRNVPAGGILLVVKSDPTGDEDHPLAGGWNFGARNTWTPAKPGEAHWVRGVNENSARYMVASTFNEMPDGDFVLILRNRQDRNGSTNDNNIRDVAGYVPGNGLKVDDGSLFTNLWPLKNFGAPWYRNEFNNNTVHRRQHAGVDGTKRSRTDRDHVDDAAFRDIGWTGVGYKRNALDLPGATMANLGGTPGHPDSADPRHNRFDTTTRSSVIVSEVMPSAGPRNLPEWIELFNTSKTEGVSVNKWRITITNHDQDSADGLAGSFAGDLSISFTLGADVIPPNQPYLIVARHGRDDTNLPDERIHSVGRRAGQLLLNPYGFQIKVEAWEKDNVYHAVETVGNLGAAPTNNRRPDAQSFQAVAWDLPATVNADNVRVSLVRVPDTGAAKGVVDGMKQGAWKLFDMSNQIGKTLDDTYYGHSSDLGSPGHSVGGVLPVSLSKFRPERLKDTGEIVVRWITESELNNAGFNILRSENRDGEFTKVHFVAGQGTTSERTLYEWKDKSAKPNVVYYYQIQDVSLDGEVSVLATTHLRGNVSAAGKLTTTWGELKALQ